MKSRPLKVGEYRKVKTWEQLLATEGAKVDEDGDLVIGYHIFLSIMKTSCGKVVKIIRKNSIRKNWFAIESCGCGYMADFFTNDYYDSKGNEIKMENEEFKVGDVFLYDDGSTFEITMINEQLPFPLVTKWNNGTMGVASNSSIVKLLKSGKYRQIHKNEGEDYVWVDDINPLDQLELEAKQTLAKIAKLREIEAKQAEIDTKIEEQNKRIEEYERE